MLHARQDGIWYFLVKLVHLDAHYLGELLFLDLVHLFGVLLPPLVHFLAVLFVCRHCALSGRLVFLISK